MARRSRNADPSRVGYGGKVRVVWQLAALSTEVRWLLHWEVSKIGRRPICRLRLNHTHRCLLTPFRCNRTSVILSESALVPVPPPWPRSSEDWQVAIEDSFTHTSRKCHQSVIQDVAEAIVFLSCPNVALSKIREDELLRQLFVFSKQIWRL